MRSRRRTLGQNLLVAALGLVVGLIGCAALRDDLKRAERAFNDARYEDVEVWLGALEGDVPDMERPLRATFYYLRGATAYRLQRPADARHYLALCREEAGAGAVALKPEWRRGLDQMLGEVDGSAKSSGGQRPVQTSVLP